MRAFQIFPRLAVLVIACSLQAGEWPHYLGPNGDLSSPETIRTNWSAQPPRQVWRRPVGPGWSSMTISSGRLFTQERRQDREFCVALAADTGQSLWATDIDAADYTNLSGYDDRIDGPRSTPTVENGRVYVFSSQLKLYALNATNGTVLWRRDFRAEFDSDLIAWENAASPLIVGDLIFVNGNASGRRLMALRKADGVTVWSGQNDGMTHASPVLGRIDGVPQVVFLTAAGLVSVVPETGAVLWRLPFTPSATSTAASPSFGSNYVHASAAYASGTWLARVTRNGAGFTATQAARQQGNAYQLHWATPVYHEGFFYCVPAPSSGQGRLTCFDIAGGTNRWSRAAVGAGNIGYGTVMKAANTLAVLTEEGEIVLVQPNPAAYTETARFKALNLYSWNHMALANGRLYARNSSLNSEIVALDVADALSPLPAMKLAAERIPDTTNLRITARALDGFSLDSSHAQRIELTSSFALSLPPAQWTAIPVSFAVNAGALVAELPLGSEAARFLRLRERNAGN